MFPIHVPRKQQHRVMSSVGNILQKAHTYAILTGKMVSVWRLAAVGNFHAFSADQFKTHVQTMTYPFHNGDTLSTLFLKKIQ